MAAVGTPGLAYAVVSPEGVEHAAAFGVDGDGVPVTSRTPFLWGSVAKPVTATAVLTLVGEGLIDLDATVLGEARTGAVEPRTDPWGPALVWGVTAVVPLSVAVTVALSVTIGAHGVAVVRRGRGNRRPRPGSVR